MQSTLLTECIPHEWSLSQRINSRLWNPPPPLLFRVGRRNRNLENKWRLRNKITNWQNVYHSFHFLCVLPLFSFSPRHFVACKILVLSLPRLKPITIFCYLTHTTVHHFLPSTLILYAIYQRFILSTKIHLPSLLSRMKWGNRFPERIISLVGKYLVNQSLRSKLETVRNDPEELQTPLQRRRASKSP